MKLKCVLLQSILRHKYESLKADLVHVEKTSAEYTVLEKYLSVTAPQWKKLEILDVWKVDRDGAVSNFLFCIEIPAINFLLQVKLRPY